LNSKYGTLAEAANHNDGLAVLAIFIEVIEKRTNGIFIEIRRTVIDISFHTTLLDVRITKLSNRSLSYSIM
jgi:hypothetical protein